MIFSIFIEKNKKNNPKESFPTLGNSKQKSANISYREK